LMFASLQAFKRDAANKIELHVPTNKTVLSAPQSPVKTT